MISARPLLRLRLTLKLRELSGDAFQRFTDGVLGERYGVQYVRTRPFGTLGDDGCDGYVQGIGAFVACYGRVNDAAINVAKTIAKAESDFEKAFIEFPGQVKKWYFVNNLLDGVLPDLIKLRNKLAAEHPAIEFTIAGFDWFMTHFDELTIEQQERLLGQLRVPGEPDEFDFETLGSILNSLDDASRNTAPINAPMRPVPQDKLEINGLSEPFRRVISDGWIWNDNVRTVLSLDVDPPRGERIASYFRGRYQQLKAAQLAPDDIFARLFESVQGNRPMPRSYVPIAAVLAHFFDVCDIFEGTP